MERWCAEGGGQDKSVMNVNRMMLRFRPIAPKPSTGEGSSGGEQPENKTLAGLKGRTKRKYVRVRRNSGYRKSKKELTGQGQDGHGLEKEIVTLQLLPEKADHRVEAEEEEERWWCSIDGTERTRVGVGTDPPTWMNRGESVGCSVTDLTADSGGEGEARVVESWVTVECVTDTCNNMDGDGVLWSRDMERVKKRLEEDTCPAMISDGVNNRVEWVNGAYRRMVRQGNDRQLSVGLVVKERLPSECGAGFSCRVRVQYLMMMGQNHHKVSDQWSQVVVPCDVWKINGGGFAWRLDIEAALRLGR